MEKKCFCHPEIDTIISETGIRYNRQRQRAKLQTDVSTQEVLCRPAQLKMLHTIKNKTSHHVHSTYISKNQHAQYAWAHSMQCLPNVSSFVVKHNFGSIITNWLTNTIFSSVFKQLLFPSHNRRKKRGEKEERRSGLLEASHYYGNIAHTAQHCTDAGCHGYTVITLPKESPHKQQSGWVAFLNNCKRHWSWLSLHWFCLRSWDTVYSLIFIILV